MKVTKHGKKSTAAHAPRSNKKPVPVPVCSNDKKQCHNDNSKDGVCHFIFHCIIYIYIFFLNDINDIKKKKRYVIKIYIGNIEIWETLSGMTIVMSAIIF